MNKVELRSLKKGEVFKRKADAQKIYIKEHYNRADSWGPASYCCTDWDDIGRSIQMKGAALVFVGFDY